jgi:hypothetical protein
METMPRVSLRYPRISAGRYGLLKNRLFETYLSRSLQVPGGKHRNFGVCRARGFGYVPAIKSSAELNISEQRTGGLILMQVQMS